MPQLPDHTTPEAILQLEQEIAALQSELQSTEHALNTFEAQIRTQLHHLIHQIHDLQDRYRNHKKAKKAKRLEQKQRGKNYKAPTGIQKSTSPSPAPTPINPAEQQELKRRFKEAILQIHPDRFAAQDQAQTDRATQVTIQLTDLYQRGDLDALIALHEHILSGNAMTYTPTQPATLPNPEAMLSYLQRQKADLLTALTELKSSHLYTVLHTYPDPQTFIPELQLQFQARIQILQKRTRKA